MRLRDIVWLLSGLSAFLLCLGSFFLTQEPTLEIIEIIQVSNVFQEILPAKSRLNFIYDSLSNHSLTRANLPKTSILTQCFPMTFGISEQQDPDYFIIKKFICPDPDPSQKLLLLNNKFEMTCQDPNQLITIGNKMSEERYGFFPSQDVWEKYVGPVDSNGAEFAFGKCGNSHLAVLENRVNENAAKRAEKKANELYFKHNVTEHRPLTVLILVLDSLSRQSFYRNLPITTVFFREIQKSDTLVYDFLLNNAAEFFTRPNLTPLLLGKKLDKHIEEVNGDILLENDWEKYEKAQNKTALWKEFEKYGFVTLFTADTSADYFAKSTGRKIFTDHNVLNFWRVAEQGFAYDEFTEGSQCIANKQPHDYQFKYLAQFDENYKNLNKFAYVHMSTGHEESCSRLKNIDKSLKDFLENFIEKQRENNKEFIVFVAGDHGRYYHPLTLESLTEKLLPGHFLLASKSLISRIDTHKTLQHNTDMLLTRDDWYVTWKYMAQFPYLKTKPEAEKINKFLKKKTYEKPAKVLFFQEAEENRTCKALNILEKSCICHNEYVQDLEPEKNYTKVVSKTVSVINKYINTHELSDFCEQIQNYEISSIKLLKKVFENEIQTLKISVKLQPSNANLLISAYIPYEKGLIRANNRNRLLANRTQILAEINRKCNFNTLHVYDISLENDLENPQLLDPILHSEFLNLCINKKKPHITLSPAFQSCQTSCNSLKMTCADFLINKSLQAEIQAFQELFNEKKKNFSEKNTEEQKIHDCHSDFFLTSHTCVCF